MPPQTAVIIWILIIFALIVPALAAVRLLPSPWSTMRDQHHIAVDKRRAQLVDRAMTLQEAKSIARHLGLTLRKLRSGERNRDSPANGAP
jgi:hypothetical protein